MKEPRSLKWILVVSIVLLWISWPSPTIFFGVGFFADLPIYHLPPIYTEIELVWYAINRAYIPTLLLTIMISTLYLANIGRKELLYSLSLYLFMISMVSFLITFAQMLIGLPYRFR